MKASEMKVGMVVIVRSGYVGRESPRGVIEAINGGKAFVLLPDRGYWVIPSRLREIIKEKP